VAVALSGAAVAGMVGKDSSTRSKNFVAAAPAAGTECPTTRSAVTDRQATALNGAAGSIERIGKTDQGARSFSGVSVCEPTNTLRVYRVPNSDEFDKQAADVAREFDVVLELQDSEYSREDLLATQREVLSRVAELNRNGAHLEYVGVVSRDGGYVELAVSGDTTAAQAVVADLGKRVRVVEDEVVPLSG
jgi:hypothetical protein